MKRFLLIFAVLAWVIPAAHAAQAPRLNVLLIIVDDLKPDLGCYGNTEVRSPNIDRLAAAGIVFDRAYCQQAVCAPSRASFLTGLRPDSTRIYDLNTPVRSVLPDVVTLPQRFKQAGYHTAALGKVYHHPQDDLQGFSEPPWRPANDCPGNNPSGNDALAEGEKPRGPRGEPAVALDLPEEQFGDGQTAARAVATLAELKDKPFFLAVGISKPHLPFVVPQRYWDMYDESKLALAQNAFAPKGAPAIAMTNFAELRQYKGVPKKGPISDELARQLVHGYRAATSFADAQVGKILDEVDRLHLRQRTIIVLIGDHGWHLGDHGLWTKHTNFESATRTPLILCGPPIRPQQRSGALVELVDLYPTLCELTGVSAPENLQGTSFVPLLSDPDRPWKQAAFSQFPHAGRMGYSVTDGRYRLTRWQTREPDKSEIELYDHQTDPQENVNLADDVQRGQELRRMSELLDRGWQSARRAASSAKG